MNLQDVVDELAETLGRSVVINDLAYRPVVASAQGDEIDEVRARSLLRRQTPPLERAHLESLRLLSSRRPLTIDLSRFQARERLAIPIWTDDEPVGVLWLITGGMRPLHDQDYRAIDAAVDVARDLLVARDGGSAGSARTAVMRALLSADAVARRDALTAAVRSYGVERGEATVVRAVAVGHDTGVVQRAALGRALEHLAGPRLHFLGDERATLLFLGRSVDGEVADAAITETAAHAGTLLRAIGTASLRRDDDDLRAVADRALSTAAVAEILPHLGGRADAADIGPWLLIADIVTDPSRLQLYSPAAHLLLNDADPLRRQTIEAFLDGAGRVRDVCDVLHIHRTTLYYRLENMPDAVRAALDDGLARSALHVALKLARYWEHSGRI